MFSRERELRVCTVWKTNSEPDRTGEYSGPLIKQPGSQTLPGGLWPRVGAEQGSYKGLVQEMLALIQGSESLTQMVRKNDCVERCSEPATCRGIQDV